MPVIHEYTADASPGAAFDTRQAREADTGGVGNALANFGNTISQVAEQVKRREGQAEITKLSSQIAEAHANTSTDLDNITANPPEGDYTKISESVMKNYDDRMDNISENISTDAGRQYFERLNGNTRGHFLQASMHNQANAAGLDAQSNQVQALNSWSNQVLGDPSSYEVVQKNSEDSIQALMDHKVVSKSVGEQMIAESDTKLAVAQARGFIQIDPWSAKNMIKSGKWSEDLDSDQTLALEKIADEEIKGRKTQANQDQKLQDDAQKARAEKQQDSLLSKMIQGKQINVLNEIVRNPDLSNSDKLHYVSLVGKSASDQQKQADDATYNNLLSRIHKPEGDPYKITDTSALNPYMDNGTITIQQAKELRNEMAGVGTPEGEANSILKKNVLKMANDALVKVDPITMQKDPGGEQRLQAFSSAFLRAFNAKTAAGIPAHDLLDPTNKAYLGKMLDQYRPSSEEVMQSLLPAPTPKIGDVVKGFKYKGGPVGDKSSWEKSN